MIALARIAHAYGTPELDPAVLDSLEADPDRPREAVDDAEPDPAATDPDEVQVVDLVADELSLARAQIDACFDDFRIGAVKLGHIPPPMKESGADIVFGNLLPVYLNPGDRHDHGACPLGGQIDALLRVAGFREVEYFGDWDGAPMHHRAESLIAVAR